MTSPTQAPIRQWTRSQAALLAIACLSAGIAGGWAIQGFRSRSTTTSSAASAQPKSNAPSAAQPDPAQMRAAADTQAAPLLERLKTSPEDPQALTELGNLYYDAHQYQIAVDYYQRALKVRPADAAARTDMATAYWYLGNADLALTEFNKALSFAPDNPNTLFNRGLVKWKAKRDSAGALADWQRLLATDPAYDQKVEVEQMIAQVKKQ